MFSYFSRIYESVQRSYFKYMHGFGFHAEQTPAAPPYPILPHVTPVIKIQNTNITLCQ